MPDLSLLLFGSPCLKHKDELVRIERYHLKAIALLAYLAVSETEQRRDMLAALLWPALERGRARAALSNLLWALNKTFDKGWLQVERGILCLNRGTGLWIDVDQFQRLLEQYRLHDHLPEQMCTVCLNLLTEAVALYRDDFMAGFDLRGSPEFAAWQRVQAERWRAAQVTALQELTRYYVARQAFDQAVFYARRWLALDPLYEPAHQCLMQLYARVGQRAAALRQYQECQKVLEGQLGLSLQETTVQLYRDIQANRLSSLSLYPDLQPHPRCPHNLPTQPAPFVGRERELADVARFLGDPACRLLTLVGLGGIGKTRLAIQSALQASVEKAMTFSHGICFVPLAALESAHLLPLAIADALKFPFQSDASPQAQLLNYLRDKQMLLVLDNLEHLLDGVGFLIEILCSAPSVKLLVTSRERLNVKWEQVFEVEGLRFPPVDQAAAIETYGAVQLFLESARRVGSDFTPLEVDKPCIAHLCRFLEGMPLGIELAAGWTPVLTCREVAGEIERNLAFLTTTLKDVPQRHRSLHAVFDHSWDRLSQEEQNALGKLAVFRGGFRREAATHVACASQLLLAALIKKSFLHRHVAGRYEMLEVLRQYIEEKLGERARDSARDQHCRYYAEFVQQREAQLMGEKLKEALKELGEEVENLRAAWGWAVARKKVTAIGQFLVGLYTFYVMRGWFREGEKALASALEALGDVDGAPDQVSEEETILFGRILTRRGAFCVSLGRYQEALASLQQSLEVLDRAGARSEMAFSLANLGTVAELSDEFDHARQLYRQGLAIFQASETPRGIGYCLRRLGAVAFKQGQYAKAEHLFQESLAIWQEMGNQLDIARCLGNLGLLAEQIGDYEKAKRLHLESIDVSQEFGLPWETANSCINLGFTLCALGEHAQAKTYFKQALETAVDTRTVPMALEALLGIAMLLAHKEQQEKAFEMTCHLLDHPAAFWDVKSRARELITALEVQLGPETTARLWSRVKVRKLQDLVRDLAPITQTEALCAML